jgi:hypothetical protein
VFTPCWCRLLKRLESFGVLGTPWANSGFNSRDGGQMTRGQIAYEADLLEQPTYDNGEPRPIWSCLPVHARQSWNAAYG